MKRPTTHSQPRMSDSRALIAITMIACLIVLGVTLLVPTLALAATPLVCLSGIVIPVSLAAAAARSRTQPNEPAAEIPPARELTVRRALPVLLSVSALPAILFHLPSQLSGWLWTEGGTPYTAADTVRMTAVYAWPGIALIGHTLLASVLGRLVGSWLPRAKWAIAAAAVGMFGYVLLGAVAVMAIAGGLGQDLRREEIIGYAMVVGMPYAAALALALLLRIGRSASAR